MIKVAIFDDDSLTRQAVRSMIERLPDCAVCFEAASGKDAADATLRENPDFVFMDTQMPEVDGFAALRRVKRACPDLPVVMLSAYEDVTLVRQAIKFGAQDFLIKPLTPPMIEKALAPLRDKGALLKKQAEKLAGFAKNAAFPRAYHDIEETAKILSTDRTLLENYDAAERTLLAGYVPLGAPTILETAVELCVTAEEWTTFKWLHTLCGVTEKSAIVQNALVQDILGALFSDLSVPVKLSAIGEKVHLSEGYLSEVFKKAMGVSVVDYGHIGRVARAAYGLLKEDLSMQDCADRLGYRDKSYFSKIFKKYTGQNFSDYKKKYQ